MKLQTKIHIAKQKNQIDYDSKVLLLGSCFAQNIGDKIAYYKFKNLQNPFGIIFHPIGIEKLITRAIQGTLFVEDDIFLHNSQWLCFEGHSKLGKPDRESFLKFLNENLIELREYLISASHVILTFGTAWVYQHRASKKIVSNCHKIPQQEFSKKLLSVDEVSESINTSISLIRSVNPNAVIITTVSPVRHLKDGFVENSRSKAHLLAGLHQCVDSSEGLFYFPAYELLFDEMRDYRFYKEDMVHPNTTAITIIWERFKDTWISSKTEEIQKEVENIQKMMLHKPLNPLGEAYIEFEKSLKLKIELLRAKYPNLDI